MIDVAGRWLAAGRLRTSRNPAALFAAGALEAMRASGNPDGRVDFIVLAVPEGQGAPAYTAALEAVQAADERPLEPADAEAG